MLALSVRQPYAELILRGIKTIEFRSRPTRVIGQRFYLYASRGGGDWRKSAERAGAKAWSLDLAMPDGAGVPPWMGEMARALRLFPGELPTGVIVGSAMIERVMPGDATTNSAGFFHWHLADVKRLVTPRKPKGRPQPVWWRAE